MPLEVKLKGTDEFVSVEVVGKRRGYLRLKFESGSTKWVELNAGNELRGDDEAMPKPPSKASVSTSTDEKSAPSEGSKDVSASRVLGAQMASITRKQNYSQQGAFFLNAYWNEYSKDCEEIWKVTQMMEKSDLKNGKNGKCLEENMAMRLLQDLGMPMSRTAFVTAMKKIDINNDKKMSLLEFLLFKYKEDGVDVEDLMSRPQDGMTDDLTNAIQKQIDTEKALAALHEEKEELLEQAKSGVGIAAMKARIQAEKFKVQEFKELEHDLKKSEIMIKKARKSPELREKGTEWFVSRAGDHAKPKKAQSASAMTDGKGEAGTDKAENVDEGWREELQEVIRQFNYVQQAGFFLNAYWEEINEQAEALWEYCLNFAEHDVKNGEDGSFLDEDQTAKLLRNEGEDRTALGFRKLLAGEICLGKSKVGKPDKKMSLLEFVLWKFQLDINDCMTRDQGGHSDTIRKGKKRLKEIEKETAAWNGKVEAMKEKAELPGNKGIGAKHQLAQGFGKKDLDNLCREKERVEKKVRKAENSDEIKEPGFCWIIERQQTYAQANPTHGR